MSDLTPEGQAEADIALEEGPQVLGAVPEHHRPGDAHAEREPGVALGIHPAGDQDPRTGVDPILLFAAALSKNWEDPASVENVITSPSDPALFGSMTGILANPNLVPREYSEMAGELESLVVRQMASLVGVNQE